MLRACPVPGADEEGEVVARSTGLFACALLVFVAVGCASTPAAPSAATATQAAVSIAASAAPAVTPAPTQATASVAPATPAPTVAVSVVPSLVASVLAPSAAAAQVNLSFSGARVFTAVGSAGRCTLGKDGAGNVASFGWEGTEADYPGLGLSFSMAQFAGNDYVDIKWVIANGGDAYARPGPAQAGANTVTESADKHSVTLDVDLQPFGKSPAEHVSGTITCP
jgi:hypothetical protein